METTKRNLTHEMKLLLKEEVEYLSMWMQMIESDLLKSEMRERFEFIKLTLNTITKIETIKEDALLAKKYTLIDSETFNKRTWFY